MTKALTIIVPTKNEAANIATCLGAFDDFRQRVRLIVVDNFSGDGTQAIAAAKEAEVYEQGPERCAQRNRGWREADTEFVMFVDADMIVPAATIAEILQKIEATAAIDALYIPEVRVGRGLRIAARNFEREFYNGTVIDGLRVIRRELLKRIGGYDENLVACEDWDLDRRLLAIGARVAITQGHLLHNEAAQTLKVFLRKKAYYSSSIAAYREKWGEDAITRKQFGLGYRYFTVFTEGGKWRKLFRHPLLFSVMMLERIAVGIVYLLKR